jgi:hypothetical protein
MGMENKSTTNIFKEVAPIHLHHVPHSTSLVLSYVAPFTVNYLTHCMSLVLSCVAPLTVHYVPHSVSFVLSYVAPLTVHHVTHCMSFVWDVAHHSLFIMWLTACPLYWASCTTQCALCDSQHFLFIELYCTTHCASCDSQHVLRLSCVAPHTVHYVPHSTSLVWAMLQHSLCIMSLTVWPWHFLPYFFTHRPGPQEDYCFPTDVTFLSKIQYINLTLA